MNTATTTVARVDEHSDPIPTLEEAFAEAIQGMRERFADSTSDDYFDEFGRRVLEERPLIVVMAAMGSETLVWAMQPGSTPDRDAALFGRASHWANARLGNNCTEVKADMKSKVLDDIANAVGWLVKEKTSAFPAGH